MTIPPAYPRIPHLVAGRGTTDDRILGSDEAAELLASPVVVEEKLDGANVMLWREDDGQLACSLRSGPGASDRARQLGPLKAWVAARAHELGPRVEDGMVVYGEWLLLTHTISYDRLPSYFVVLDVVDGAKRFLGVEARGAWASAAGLSVPPEVRRGVVGSIAAADELIGPSAYGPERAEGVVLRPLTEGNVHAAKLVREGFRAIGDDAWTEGRPRNVVVGEEAAAWR